MSKEEFEKAYAESKKEWTHKTSEGDMCRLLVAEPDSNGNVVIVNEDGLYKRRHSHSITKIKTKITKAQAWDYVSSKDADVCISVDDVKELYEVVDSVNDKYEVEK